MSSETFEPQRAALADVVAIPVTPFAEDGTVDRDTHRALLQPSCSTEESPPSPPTGTPASSTPSAPKSAAWSRS